MNATRPPSTALLLGLMAEVALAGTLLVWSTSPDASGRAPFGQVAAKAILIVAMAALALAMAALKVAARLGRTTLRICVIVGSLPVAGVGALAVGSLFSDPGGPVILLVVAWISGVLVVLAVSRASALRRAA
jgi:hypothetical protein